MTIIDYITNAENVLIVGHQRPDGDCLGAGLTMRHLCKKYNKKVDFLFDSPIPEHFAFLPDYECLNQQNCTEYDLVITVDCADSMRMGRFVGYLKAPVTINIDHHKTNDKFALVNIVERFASSTCEVLFKILDGLDLLDDSIAYWLYVGLSTDTGHFMHNNTNSLIFSIASRLCTFNINPSEICTYIYKSNTYNKTRLIAKAIESMRFFADGKICIETIITSDLEECGCVLADTEGLIDYAMRIGTVEVAVCITESNRAYKVSFRSRKIDVAASAATFGGGGHTLAAGCVIGGYYEDVIKKIVKSITDGMDF